MKSETVTVDPTTKAPLNPSGYSLVRHLTTAQLATTAPSHTKEVTVTTDTLKIYNATGDTPGDWALIESHQEITKEDIGLGNVDNTSDINKPNSIATSTAILAARNQSKNDLKTKVDAARNYETEEHRRVAKNADYSEIIPGHMAIVDNARWLYLGDQGGTANQAAGFTLDTLMTVSGAHNGKNRYSQNNTPRVPSTDVIVTNQPDTDYECSYNGNRWEIKNSLVSPELIAHSEDTNVEYPWETDQYTYIIDSFTEIIPKNDGRYYKEPATSDENWQKVGEGVDAGTIQQINSNTNAITSEQSNRASADNTLQAELENLTTQVNGIAPSEGALGQDMYEREIRKTVNANTPLIMGKGIQFNLLTLDIPFPSSSNLYGFKIKVHAQPNGSNNFEYKEFYIVMGFTSSGLCYYKSRSVMTLNVSQGSFRKVTMGETWEKVGDFAFLEVANTDNTQHFFQALITAIKF